MRAQSWVLLALLTEGVVCAQTLLFDDFSDGTIDSGLWSVSLPFSQSKVSESGGLLTTTGRGTLATADGFSGGLTIYGTVTMNHGLENFNILLRSDLSQYNEYWERTGISVCFLNPYDVGVNGMPGISITKHTPSGGTILATSSFSLLYGEPYDFAVTDSGDRVAVVVEGVERASAATTYASGDRIAFFSREFNDTSSSLDYVAIVVPEPATLALLGLGLLAFLADFHARGAHR